MGRPRGRPPGSKNKKTEPKPKPKKLSSEEKSLQDLRQGNFRSPVAVAEEKAIDDFVRKIKGLSLAEATDVLSGLDPDFVKAVLRRLMANMDDDSRSKLFKIGQRMEKEFQPVSDEQLWQFVAEECGLKIPRKAVCEGHVGPFMFMSDVYFARGNPDKLAIGNRGSGKTQIIGALHAVNSRTKPNYTACTVGAVEAQSMRAYGFFKDIVTQDKWMRLIKGRILMGGTTFDNGAKVEIVTGTMTGVNSPHPVLAHFDEVELLREGVFDEGLNMAQSKDGHRAMNVLTSSWKKARGFVSDLVDEGEKARREGHESPYEIYRWCVWETTEPCPHDCNACPFAKMVKGTWEDGTARTFESACKKGSPEPGVGKLKFTDGFVSVDDAVARFRKLPKRVWEAQQESKRPTLEGLVYDCFDEELHTVWEWDPDPAKGPIDVGLDFGGTNAHAATFWQTLNVEVYYGNRRIPEGSSVCFDEVYVSDVGNVEFGRRINEVIAKWGMEHPSFRVTNFFRDPAAKAAGMDLARLSYFVPDDQLYRNIITRFSGHVTVEERIALVYELMDGNLVYFDKARCENTLNELGGYEMKNGKPVKEDDHAMDAMGYRFWNRHAGVRRKHGTGQAVAAKRSRAITREAGRGWDPGAIGDVPSYGEGGGSPSIGWIPRTRPTGTPWHWR